MTVRIAAELETEPPALAVRRAHLIRRRRRETLRAWAGFLAVAGLSLWLTAVVAVGVIVGAR